MRPQELQAEPAFTVRDLMSVRMAQIAAVIDPEHNYIIDIIYAQSVFDVRHPIPVFNLKICRNQRSDDANPDLASRRTFISRPKGSCFHSTGGLSACRPKTNR